MATLTAFAAVTAGILSAYYAVGINVTATGVNSARVSASATVVDIALVLLSKMTFAPTIAAPGAAESAQ